MGGRPKGSSGTPAYRRIAARLEEDFPDYHPVAVMAEGAIALAERARQNPDMWAEAVAASDKVAAYMTPKLKAVEITGEDGGPLKVTLVSIDQAL